MENINSLNPGLEKTLRWFIRLGLLVALTLIVVLVSGIALPFLAPDLTHSLLAADSQLFWYASRGSAIVGYILLWASTAMGLMMSTRLGKTWPGMKFSYNLHQFISNLGFLFIVFHALILLGDQYMKPGLLSLLIPFNFQNYLPVWVGIGQIVIYLWGILAASFYAKKLTGHKVWRALHYAGFLAFFGGTLHGITSGTDSSQAWMQFIYWASASSVLFLTIYRILMRKVR